MAQLPEKVLAWLYSVLHEYRDPQRTYSDAIRTLSSTPTLTPRTEVYTYENGSSALLLTISGTLPVGFRGTTYQFPVKLWIPHSFPQGSPIVYVTPSKDMIVRPGQHVGVDGRVYHPYLRDWTSMWDRASTVELVGFLQQVFAKEPPVISKAQQQQFQRPIGQAGQQARAAAPQLPPKQAIERTEAPNSSTAQGPGPLPPKIEHRHSGSVTARTPSRDIDRDGPPLPPLPHELAQRDRPAPIGGAYDNYRPSPPYAAQSTPPYHPQHQNGGPSGPAPPPLPRLEARQQTHRYSSLDRERSPVSPISPANGVSELPPNHFTPMMPYNPHDAQITRASGRVLQSAPGGTTGQYGQQYQQNNHRDPPSQQQYQQPQPQQRQQQQYYQPHNYSYQQQHLQNPRPPPPKDLLSDPFDVAIVSPSALSSNQPAPPIPPNPEREHLLQALSTTLVQQAQQKIHQNASAHAPLQAQQIALRAAHDRLQAEMKSLEGLEAVLASNESILHRSLIECDRTIDAAKAKPAPPIDEVLIAPTMVANQLWTLCAEEAACRETMYVLQTAVDKGRISGSDFIRQMRSLGRERFLKMALARKCARGMGLDMGQIV